MNQDNTKYLKGAGRKIQEDLFLVFGARAGLDSKIDDENILVVAMKLAEILKYTSFAKSHTFLARVKINDEIESVEDVEYLVEMFRNVLFAVIDTVSHGRRLLDNAERATLKEFAEDKKRWFKKYNKNVIESAQNILNSCNGYVNSMSQHAIELKSEVDAAIDELEKVEKKIKERVLNSDINDEIKKIKAKQQATLDFYSAQLALLLKHKEAGAEIDKEIMEMQGKLAILEKEENSDMVQDLIKTLHSLQS
nr:hypothetical protein pM02_c5_04 [uncultured bacterium]